jgi:hypothetical protein
MLYKKTQTCQSTVFYFMIELNCITQNHRLNLQTLFQILQSSLARVAIARVAIARVQAAADRQGRGWRGEESEGGCGFVTVFELGPPWL